MNDNVGVQDLNALLTFEKMLRLVYFFDLYLAKRYQEALMVIHFTNFAKC